MWLGDISNLPKSEQYYLLSENVRSDHAIGSEFYDGQIECIFTDPTPEDDLIRSRSEFLEAAESAWGQRISQLDDEILRLIEELGPPIHLTKREQHTVFDRLNKICVETLDLKGIKTLLRQREIDPKDWKQNKSLEALLKSHAPDAGVSDLMSPFFVLYDLRVATSHLMSDDSSTSLIQSCLKRLALTDDSMIEDVYGELVKRLVASYEAFTTIL
ncbi:MAG: hypothetical protein EOP09_00115 [Proteobacteria bacterium]|nr:MAG: hypothetical protein EOP09_00115 [Pseudomonadota bacterium]